MIKITKTIVAGYLAVLSAMSPVFGVVDTQYQKYQEIQNQPLKGLNFLNTALGRSPLRRNLLAQQPVRVGNMRLCISDLGNQFPPQQPAEVNLGSNDIEKSKTKAPQLSPLTKLIAKGSVMGGGTAGTLAFLITVLASTDAASRTPSSFPVKYFCKKIVVWLPVSIAVGAISGGILGCTAGILEYLT